MVSALVIGHRVDVRPPGHNHDRLVAEGAAYAALGVAPAARAGTRKRSWWSRWVLAISSGPIAALSRLRYSGGAPLEAEIDD
jgi:hypothetical protein